MSRYKGIYKECVALIYINIVLYQIGRRKGIKRRKIKRDKVGKEQARRDDKESLT